VEKPFSYIIKVIYFVPLVCYECSVFLFSETNSRRHYRVVYVGFAVRAHMEGEPVVIKTLLNTLSDIYNRFAA